MICPICGLKTDLMFDDKKHQRYCSLCLNYLTEDDSLPFELDNDLHVASVRTGIYEADIELIRGFKDMVNYQTEYSDDGIDEFEYLSAEDEFESYLVNKPNASYLYWGLFKAKNHICYGIETIKNKIARPFCFYHEKFEIDENDENYLLALKYAETPLLKEAYEKEFKKIIEIVKEYFSLPIFKEYDAYFDSYDSFLARDRFVKDVLPMTDQNSQSYVIYKTLSSLGVNLYWDYLNKSLSNPNIKERVLMFRKLKTILIYAENEKQLQSSFNRIAKQLEEYKINIKDKIIISISSKVLGGTKHIPISRDNSYIFDVYKLFKDTPVDFNKIDIKYIDFFNEHNEGDFIVKCGVLKKYNGQDEIVDLPPYIRCIGKHAFKDNQYVKGIKSLEFVQIIDDEAFLNSGITSIFLPFNIFYLGKGAFKDCKHLTKVTFESDAFNGLVTISEEAFKGCSLLKEIELSSEINAIKEEAFKDIIIDNIVHYPSSKEDYLKIKIYDDNDEINVYTKEFFKDDEIFGHYEWVKLKK